MKHEFIRNVRAEMSDVLSEAQITKLHEVLLIHLENVKMIPQNNMEANSERKDYLRMYLAAKEIEGCSDKTLKYYKSTLQKMITQIDKNICQINTEDIRIYLAEYQQVNKTSICCL